MCSYVFQRGWCPSDFIDSRFLRFSYTRGDGRRKPNPADDPRSLQPKGRSRAGLRRTPYPSRKDTTTIFPACLTASTSGIIAIAAHENGNVVVTLVGVAHITLARDMCE